MTETKSYISGYEIFNYWKDRTDINGFEYIPDWGERLCFGCKKKDSAIYEDSYPNLKAFWNGSTSLEKAHIVAKQFGGSYEPCNIVFLCKSCHKESPDFNDREPFLLWLSSKRVRCVMGIDLKTYEEETMKLINIYNMKRDGDSPKLTAESISQALKGKSDVDLKEYMEDKIGSHAGSVAVSTYAAGVVSYILHMMQASKEQNKITPSEDSL